MYTICVVAVVGVWCRSLLVLFYQRVCYRVGANVYIQSLLSSVGDSSRLSGFWRPTYLAVLTRSGNKRWFRDRMAFSWLSEYIILWIALLLLLLRYGPGAFLVVISVWGSKNTHCVFFMVRNQREVVYGVTLTFRWLYAACRTRSSLSFPRGVFTTPLRLGYVDAYKRLPVCFDDVSFCVVSPVI